MSAKTTTNLRFAAFLGLSVLLTPLAQAVERQSLSGHVPAAAARAQLVGRLSGSSQLKLAISLPLRNQETLTNLLKQLYDPASPQYRHYLSPEEFAERFGPSKEDYEALAAFAKAQGLTVTGRHPNRTILDVVGSVANVERALHVNMQVYQHPRETRTFHTPDVEPSLDLVVRVLHISGLDNFNVSHPLGHKVPLDLSRQGKPLDGSAPGGGFMGKDFRTAYVPGVVLAGTGQSVAIFALDGYYANDIKDYESLCGLPNVPLQDVRIDGFEGTPGVNNDEVSMDIEMAISMAPDLSKVLVYEAAPTGNSVDVLNRIATDNAASQISSSWGWGGDAALDQIFKQYAAQGQSFFQASGDDGAFPGGYVSDDPYITTVGGTQLTTTGPGGAWVSETVWNQGFLGLDELYNSSGGGISPAYPIPSWQQGLSMTANKGSGTQRNSPDVAMVAAYIWVLYGNGDSGTRVGTSASAPLWAGFAALANQLAQANGQPPLGFVNPAIYALGKGAGYASAFHDITTGNNANAASPTNFFAVAGYDLCTGWGTPAGSNLLYALAMPEFLQISPDTSFTGRGLVGGPFYDPHFLPATQTYSLTNSGRVSLAWMVATSVTWLDASVTSGTLAAGSDATNVTVSLNAAANALALGTYPATVWFTNLSDGSVQTRLFTLEVQPMPQTAPIIVAQSTNLAVIEGGTATYTVEVSSGSLPVSYNWIRNGIPLHDGGNISGATTGTVTITDVTPDDVGVIDVIIMNFIGAVTGYAEALTIASPPVIVTQPTNQAVLPGTSARFAVGAIGTKPLTYQWQNNGTNLTSGGNANTLTIKNVSDANAGAYSVVVSNALGSVTNSGAMLAIIPVTTPGVAMTTLYSFKNASDGANPWAPLVQATDGNFYGTATSGGANSSGTAFRMTPDGVLTVLHAFGAGNDGASPSAGLIQAADGNLYGTAKSGGANNGGTVFRMSLNGALITLHAFDGGSGGYYSLDGLVQASDRNFYGTTTYGGDSNSGTVFKMTANGTFSVLHSFHGLDGENPRGGLIAASDGSFYGTTHQGGTNTAGIAFKMTATGAPTTLFEFRALNPNPFRPRGGFVLGHDGNFYGTTEVGGANDRGTVIRMTPTGLLTTLYSFAGASDGQWPLAQLVEGRDGHFYGTTSYGGTGFDGLEPNGQGTVFRISPNGALTTLLYFVGSNGANPQAALVQASDGSFYGTTERGGANGFGTVFRVSVPAIDNRPQLTITPAGGNIILSWPTNNAAGYYLQVTLEIGDPAGWANSNLPEPPIILNGNYVVTLPNSIGVPHFFRLSQ